MSLAVRFFVLMGLAWSAQAAELKTRNVVLIISDGLRWQEIFTGAEQALLSKEAGAVKNTNALARDFWRDTPELRRQALLPFFWSTIATQGQLLGNQAKKSVVTVSNQKNFSYPGYNEILTGVADPRVDSNDKKPNLNTNVFEWLAGQRGFAGKVAILGTWDVFPYIFNVERSRLPIWPSFEPQFRPFELPVPESFNKLLRDATPLWDDVVQDTFVGGAALNHLDKNRPRLMFVGFGETDEWAHSGRYDLYLRAAHGVDDFIRRLWETAQSKSQYRDKTTFIITADHGRGSGREDWKNHGAGVPGSEGDWLAVIGPDTPALGEREQTPRYSHAQIATTISTLLGYDFRVISPKSGAPIEELFGK